MEGENDEKIKELRSKIAILKADRDDLYTKLVIAKQVVESLHTDIGQIMEFIVNKRKDLSEIGQEFSATIQSDNEYKIHDIEYEFPNIHALVARDFEKALEQNQGINRIRLRGVNLFKNVNSSYVKSMYPSIPDEKLDSYLDIIWDNMSFYEKKNWMEKRVVYATVQESSEEEVPSEVSSDVPAGAIPREATSMAPVDLSTVTAVAAEVPAAAEVPTTTSAEVPATVSTEVPVPCQL
ncbi:hypothetical protein WA577_006765 [Blastocystis sp. JDR]